MQNINTVSSYAAINAIVVEIRLCSHNYGGSDIFENHDDEHVDEWFEYRIVHRDGAYAPNGEFTGECRELTKWSKDSIEQQINQLASPLWLIEIYSLPKGIWTGKLPDYVAVLGKPRQLYAVAFPLSTGRILHGVVSTDGFWEVGRTGQGVVNVPLKKERLSKQPTREQSAEMQSIAFHKLNSAGGSWNYYHGETIAVEPVEGQLGTYYKYPRFSNRFGVGSAIVIAWELDIDPDSAELLLQSQMDYLKYL